MHTDETHTQIVVTHSHSSLFSTASDNCEIHSLCTKTWPGRKIISVIELMGLSETGEQPRAAKERLKRRRRNRRRRRGERRRRQRCVYIRWEKEKRATGRKGEMHNVFCIVS